MNSVRLDQISEVPSDILYIKRFIGRIRIDLDYGSEEFFIGFSLEKKPIGPPDVELKFIDSPSEKLLAQQALIKARIADMEKAGELKHSPFEGL
jgi:hypothetical protein